MEQNTISHTAVILLAVFFCCTFLSGCQKGEGSGGQTKIHFSDEGTAGRKNEDGHENLPLRDSTPNVLVPRADGTVVYESELVSIDASHTDDGYVMLRYTGTAKKVKLQIGTPGSVTYTYLLSQSGEYETFPFPAGDGIYSLSVYENVAEEMYANICSQTIEVQLRDEFLPFLYPNQYVPFTPASLAIAKGEEIAKGAHSDLEVITGIYHYVTENILYDTEKAETVVYGYLPDIDDTLQSGKGICFDYAAVMASMLRSQRIPTKLEIGYAGDAYHAWISVYLEEIGWVDNIIEFTGDSWSLMDPTFAAGSSSGALKKFIGDGKNYMVKYSY